MNFLLGGYRICPSSDVSPNVMVIVQTVAELTLLGIPVLAQLKARHLITGNLSFSLEDPKHSWEPTTTNNHS